MSSFGNVKSLDRSIKRNNKTNVMIKGRVLSKVKARNGYEMVNLFSNGVGTKKLVHRLVAEAFIEMPDSKTEINHKNHIRNDNRVENLEWCTHLENMQEIPVFYVGEFKDSHNVNESHKCKDCGKLIHYTSTRCKSCAYKRIKHVYKNGKPISKEQVVSSLTNNKGNFTKASKEFNMSDNALRKWCSRYKLPTHSKDWK